MATTETKNLQKLDNEPYLEMTTKFEASTTKLQKVYDKIYTC